MHLLEMLEERRPLESAICEPECLNLLGAMMLRTRWTNDLSVLDAECLVVRPPVGTP